MKVKLLILTDLHLCHIAWHGMAPEARLEQMITQVNERILTFAPDALLMLGDYSLDFWQWNVGGSMHFDPPVSNTTRFVQDFVSRLTMKPIMLPGNHEQYGQDAWKQITTCDRSFRLDLPSLTLLGLDAFGSDLDPAENSDGTYTSPDLSAISAALTETAAPLLLFAHHFDPEKDTPAVVDAIGGEERILALFAGHTHVISAEQYGTKPLFRCGHYSYPRGSLLDHPWGWREVIVDDSCLKTYYYVPETHPEIDGKSYHQPQTILDEQTLAF